MIRVVKPNLPPARLTAGVALTAHDSEAFDVDREAYLEPTKSFDFDTSIYGHNTVKRALEDAQHKKCCFCEARFSANSPGDVEHFRPKQFVQQETGGQRYYPGYYWLCYVWENLFYSCPNCNRTAKRNLFPLGNPEQRARSHTDDLLAERPLLLDPGGPEDPRAHIRFKREVAVGITEIGRVTIGIVRLNRIDLVEERLRRASYLDMLANIVRIYDRGNAAQLEDLAGEATQELAQAIRPESVYSAMAQDLLA